MGDLTNPRLIYAKGFLFLFGGLLASVLLLLEAPSLQVAFLLAVAIWCFARAYYFAFYVIEHYIDPTYRFAGLMSFVRYLLQRRNKSTGGDPGSTRQEQVRGERPTGDQTSL